MHLNTSSNKKFFVSVDMDEWYLARWATGSRNAIWSSTENLFLDLYKSKKPIGEILKPTEKILKLFSDLKFKSTFFFTGFIAELYPELVKTISDEGHEIGCHNFFHVDYEHVSQTVFTKDLKKSKKILSELSGQKIVGYRSPNSSIPNYLAKALKENGFLYDTSITPTRKMLGKFGNFHHLEVYPYRSCLNDIAKAGDDGILEFPWPVFPIVKLPAGSGITHRIFGDTYNKISHLKALNKGYSSYYFHPYEIEGINQKFNKNFKIKVFYKDLGEVYFYKLEKFLYENINYLCNGLDLLKKFN